MREDHAPGADRRSRPIVKAILVGLALMCAAPGCVFVYVGGWQRLRSEYAESEVEPAERWHTSEKILLLDVDGIIMNTEISSILIDKESTVAAVKERLMRAEKDKQIRAVVLRLNSPGGGVTASDIVYHELMAFKHKTGRPIVACIMDVGASGAYYIAMAADKVVAHPTAVTGSIGVMMRYLTFDGLMSRFGVDDVTFKSGEHKDMGSLFRPVSDSEKEIFQATVDDMYDRFVTVIDAGRPGLKRDEIRRLADGRIYAATQAKAKGLIDQVGYLEDAITAAKGLAGIPDASVVTYKRALSHKNNIYSKGGSTPQARGDVNLVNVDMGRLVTANQPMFMYLWAPGE